MSSLGYKYNGKYPVVNPDPSSGDCIANFNAGDLAYFFGASFASSAFLALTASKPLRRAQGRFGLAIGIAGGFTLAITRSANRLMGYSENESEVRRYGALTEAQLTEAVRRQQMPNFDLIETNKNYERQDQIGEFSREKK